MADRESTTVPKPMASKKAMSRAPSGATSLLRSTQESMQSECRPEARGLAKNLARVWWMVSCSMKEDLIRLFCCFT